MYKMENSRDLDKECILSYNADAEAGPYFLGPPIKKCARSPVTLRLGRKKGTDNYYLMKILVLDDSLAADRGLYIRRTIFHNEYTILSLLKHQEGIIQLHDFFKDYIYKEVDGRKQKLKRVCMVMECLFPHGPLNSDLIPLNHFLKEVKLSETEALHILHNLLSVIDNMHRKNIVHREIKLSNIILNRKTLKVKLMDFYYARVLPPTSKFESNKPVVLPCLPKTNDIWAAGVVFYALLCSGCSFGMSKFGSLLSSIRSTHDLYLKLEENKSVLLKNASFSVGTKEILCCILCALPQYRLKASDALDMVSTLLAIHSSGQNLGSHSICRNSDQIVPECPNFDKRNEMKSKQDISSKNICHKVAKEDTSYCQKWIDKEENEMSVGKKGGVEIGEIHSSTASSKGTKMSGVLCRDKIKRAMKRLGATSLNNINALSFNYAKRNSYLSQEF